MFIGTQRLLHNQSIFALLRAGVRLANLRDLQSQLLDHSEALLTQTANNSMTAGVLSQEFAAHDASVNSGGPQKQ